MADRIIRIVEGAKKDRKLMSLVSQRLDEFKRNRRYFSELCFCTLTAGASALSGIKCQDALHGRFHSLNEKELQKELKALGYRFHNRAEYICSNQPKIPLLGKIVKNPSIEARDILIKNFKGIGMKEASHFLRNIGREDVAIIDKHILRSLGFNVESVSQKNYLEIEDKLRKIAESTGTNLAELDLILWHNQTGKVLK